MRKIARGALYLCVLLLLSEFGPAHFRRVHHLKASKGAVAKNEKRVWSAAQTLLGYAFKALQMGAKYFSDVTSLVSVISSVYTLIAQCESTSWGQKAKEFTDKAKELTDRINAQSSDIYAIQLETENLQVRVETLNYNFNNTLEEMQRTGYLSQEFLQIVQPDIEHALNETTSQVITQLAEAEKAGTDVDYAAITKKYFIRIDSVINLAVPIFVTAIPRIPKMVNFAKTHFGELKSWKLTTKFDNIKLPARNTKAYTKMKSWFSKSSDYVKIAKTNLRNVVKAKYGKAIKFASGLKDAFAVLSGFVFGAFNIYTAVQNFGRKDCQKIHDKAREAYQEVLKANETYTAILNNVTEAKKEMNKVKDDMIEQVSNGVFLEDLRNMKENMVEIQGEGKGMQDMIDATTMYLDNIPNNQDLVRVEALMRNLYQAAIGSLPYIYICLKDRSNLISSVVRGCKAGYRSLADQIAYSKGSISDDEDCESRTGIPYFSDAALHEAVVEVAEKENFTTECRLNNEDVINLICTYRCVPKNPQDIASSVDVSQEKVEEVITKCPLCEVTKLDEIFICSQKRNNVSNEDIQKVLKQLTVEQIGSVEC